MRGNPKYIHSPGVEVRPLKNEDLGECAALCKKVHGFDRLNELRDALKALSPLAAWRDGHIIAYALVLHRWPLNHAVTNAAEDMNALLLGAAPMNSEPLSVLLLVSQTS
jgi:hypothetical protein